jgi:hypothetical protein
MTTRATIPAVLLALAQSIWILAPASSQEGSRIACPPEYSAVGSGCFSKVGIKVFRTIEAISYVLGSKRVSGYFTRVNDECKVTLMLVEEVDPTEGDPHSAARLIVSLRPEQSASVGSAEAETMVVTCKGVADSVEVQRSPPDDRRARQARSQD